MADIEYEAGAPKKADVLIRSTQHIALKQEELSEQTRLAVERIEEAIELFNKNEQDSSYVLKQSGELFDRLQSENSVLKQELLYLAKQSENIYAGLAEKINEIAEQNKAKEEKLSGIADKVNDVAVKTLDGSSLTDKLAEVAESNKRNEDLISSLTEKLNALSQKLDVIAERTLRNERAVPERAEPVEIDNGEILSKLNYITDQLRRAEGAHSMLADKFEILSMRVEQFGFESAKGAPAAYQHPVQAVAYPAPVQPVQTVVKQDIDYDYLAEKVASLISAREVISPDYIASKVAEQIVLPEIEAAKVKVSVDEEQIARQVARFIDVRPAAQSAKVDEEALADALARRVGGAANAEIAPVNANIAIDEESLAERIAGKVSGIRANVQAGSLNLDVDELADAIALKVGSLKSEDFEILVDDEGCTSISKEIANNLDYKFISDVVAGKLRDALDIAAANAPDYEEMADRISEKITVAGINEDAIADKAAAVLSNYLPELDIDEITDKVTGAVIDVVSAMPQPTVDNETISNAIAEKLIEAQENDDYEIVIDDDGISRISELVSEGLENKNAERFDKVEEEIAKLTKMLTPAEDEEEAEAADEIAVAENQDYESLSQMLAEEIEKGTSARFDKVECELAKLAEFMNGIEFEDEPEVEYEEYDDEADYARLSQTVAEEVEKSVSVRLESVEQNIAKLTELLTEAEEAEVEETEEEVAKDENEAYKEEAEAIAEEAETEETQTVEEKCVEVQDLTALSEAVAAEVNKAVLERLDSLEEKLDEKLGGVEENISKITEMLSPEEVEDAEEGEEDYTGLSQSVAAEVENAVTARLEAIEENIAKIAELVENGVQPEDTEEAEEAVDYAVISNSVAEEVNKAISARLESVEENVARIAEFAASGAAASGTDAGNVDFTALSRIVAAEMLRGLDNRLERVEQDLGKITDYVEGDVPVETDSRIDKIAENMSKLSTYMEGELSVETAARFDNIEQALTKLSALTEQAPAEEPNAELKEQLAEIKQLLESGVKVEEQEATEEPNAELKEQLAEIKQLLESGVKAEEQEAAEESNAELKEQLAEIKQLLESGVKAEEQEATEEPNAELKEQLAEIKQLLESGVKVEEQSAADERSERLENELAEIRLLLENGVKVEEQTPAAESAARLEEELTQIRALLESGVRNADEEGSSGLEEELAQIKQMLADGVRTADEEDKTSKIEEELAELKGMLAGGMLVSNSAQNAKLEEELAQIKEMLADGARAAEAEQEAAASSAAEVIEEDEEVPLVTVSDLVEPEALAEPEIAEPEEDEEESEDEAEGDDGDDDGDFLIDVLDTDGFSDNELMPGEMSDFAGGVDFANMMKFKRSFIARIIQSRDEYKQYYGEVKHALLSYKKVNSNVAWSNERFNKGRETIARMKIRGKTLVVYLALDPNEYKTSVYHHLDVSDNKSVAGTPMMIKVKSPLGVKKAIRLIDEMLAKRNGEKKEIPERDYAAMYPYETIEELIEEGLVKDVRKK